MFFDEIRQPQQHSSAIRGFGAPPGLKRLVGRPDGLVDLLDSREGHVGVDAAGGGIDVLEGAARSGVDSIRADPQLDGGRITLVVIVFLDVDGVISGQ